MKPREKLATAKTPDGGEMVLYQHDKDYFISVNGHELMNSRHHESELELARLGCAHLKRRQKAHVLVGGMGMGYSLRQALDLLQPDARVTVGELLDTVVDWNRDILGDLNNHPLKDKRTKVVTGDVLKIIGSSPGKFDSIILDIDNGPGAITDSGNQRLYSHTGIHACRRALRRGGTLSIWSAEASKLFEYRLMKCGFEVRRFRAPAYKGSKTASHFIWVASEDRKALPKGGGEPRPPRRKPDKHMPGNPWRRK